MTSPETRAATGTAVQQTAWGASAPAPATLLEESWRDFVFAEVWSRPSLDDRAKALVAIAGAASSHAPDDLLDGYVRGALAGSVLGLAELREAALQVAVYTGWSQGLLLDRAVSRVAAELRLPAAETPPLGGNWADHAARLAAGSASFEAVAAMPATPAFSPYVDAGVLSFVMAELWTRPGLDQRSRRWLTLTCVAHSGAATPIETHVTSAIRSGNCSYDELMEFALLFAVQAGWPRGSVLQSVIMAVGRKLKGEG